MFACRRLVFANLLLCIVLAEAGSSRLVAQSSVSDSQGNHLVQQPSAIVIGSRKLEVELDASTGITRSLRVADGTKFDFAPSDLLGDRSGDSYYYLGDLDLRVRKHREDDWTSLSTAYRRHSAVIVRASSTQSSMDMTDSLPRDSGVRLVRSWRKVNDELQLEYMLTNTGSESLELGGLGIAMVFNNILNGRTLENAYQRCSFYDPYIGGLAGYVQDVPLKGTGPVLLAVPLGDTPLEAWKPILDDKDSATGRVKIGSDPTPRSVTFEGSFDWMVHSAAYADQEWKGTSEWNQPSSQTLMPKQTIRFGLRFFIAPNVREIEEALYSHGRPVAVGVPGYVLPQDIDGRLFLRYKSNVRSITSDPAGAVKITDNGVLGSGIHAYTLRGTRWGNARVMVQYDDGLVQPIDYRTTKPETAVVGDLGRFLTTQQWFADRSDPFGRAPSIISYDNEAHRPVLQERRAWIAGLSDEAGAGSYLAAAMKELIDPNAEEVARLEQFVDGVLWGGIQVKDGAHQYGVRKSLFFYDPKGLPNYTYDADINAETWGRDEAMRLDRTYNYPHVVSTYWALYRIARNTNNVVTHHPWQWYLNQAYRTTMAMKSEASLYARYGLMEGTVFTLLLDDLQAEGWNEQANDIQSYMRERTALWEKEPYPFGSEMPWDSTGQEEVYAWTHRFGLKDKADVTLNAVLGYTPTIANWGYNGSARRYWDFGTAGKLSRLERMLHHYGSGLNSIPLLTAYRDDPDDLYLLRVGYGGVMGPLTNIDQKGFASVAFHSFPDAMAFDAYSGDYGSNFFGHAVNTGTYVVHDQKLGWLCFGGNIHEEGDLLKVGILDSSRQRIFIAPLKLWITLDAGSLESAAIDMRKQSLELHFAPGTPIQHQARFEVRTTANSTSTWHVSSATEESGNHYSTPLNPGRDTVVMISR